MTGNNYFRVKIEWHKDGREVVTLRKIEKGEERVDDGNRYIKDKDGVPYRFDDKEEAIKWLNKNVIYERIDMEYRRPNQSDFLTREGLIETGKTVRYGDRIEIPVLQNAGGQLR